MYVEMRNIYKQYGNFRASDNVSFGIEKGKLAALLGPSGSGKTTLLRMIAGLENPNAGDIFIDGKRVNDIPAAKRGIGFVFQSYALFRYMTVFDNIAFGLEIAKMPKKQIKERVFELLELTGLSGLENRYPNQLSGGQRQRVAFARALAPNPQVLLLDEPFAAIDAKVRSELRLWLKEMVSKLGITSIFVTHDQDEAVEVADEILITNHGKIEQMGSPLEIYKSPKTPFVAQFVGRSSIVENYESLKGFEKIEHAQKAIVRPEFLELAKKGELKRYMSASEKGIVEDVIFSGSRLDVVVNINGIKVTAERSLEKDPVSVGEEVDIIIYRLYVFDEKETYLLENKEMQEGLINTYKESGFFPEWASPGHRDCMIGNNSASVLADAYLKGIKVEDVKTLYEGLIHGTKNVHPTVSSTGRRGYEYYNKLGYVPYDVKINENTARTLEYAYNDWCIYQLAKELKRPEKEIQLFAKRAMNYKNVFDKDSKLMRGKNEDGTFQSPFSPLKWGDAFTEGNSWHYSWSVFHDPQGLIDLMGGKDMFITMLDSVFSVPPVFDESYYRQVIHEIREMTIMNMGNYAHGNQPIQHMIYLYNYAGQPWKAQYWLRQVMDRMYTPGPDGYCGDEDNGQTSAWYVFSALGFYPVCPGTDEYVVGAPLFKKATLHLENGNSLIIHATDNNKKNMYIQTMNLNGTEYKKNYLRHEDLLKGGNINFQMGSQPNLNRGTEEESFPYSFSKVLKKIR